MPVPQELLCCKRRRACHMYPVQSSVAEPKPLRGRTVQAQVQVIAASMPSRNRSQDCQIKVRHALYCFVMIQGCGMERRLTTAVQKELQLSAPAVALATGKVLATLQPRLSVTFVA